MGFYSFYKILKDMVRTIFGKKILKITIIVILIFTIFFVYTECFAITTFNPNFQYNGLTFNINNKSSWSSGINNSPFTRFNG